MQIHHRLIRDIGRPKPRIRGVSTCSASTSLPTSTRCETSLRSMLGAVLGENTQPSTANVWILMVAWVGCLPLVFLCFDFLWGDIMWHGNMWILYPSLYLAIGNLHRNWTPWLISKERKPITKPFRCFPQVLSHLRQASPKLGTVIVLCNLKSMYKAFKGIELGVSWQCWQSK